MADNPKSGLSYSCTPSTTPYMYQSVPDRLRCLATEDPGRVAFVYYNRSGKRTAITRRELYQKSLSLAKYFHKFGIKKGSLVAICMNNSLYTLYAIYGVSLAGGILFSIATNLKDGSDVIETLNEIKAEYFVIDATVNDQNWDILDGIWPTDKESSFQVPTLKRIICNGSTFSTSPGRIHLNDLMNHPTPEDITLPTVYPEDILICFGTSGSTGKPKHVMNTHFSLLTWTKQGMDQLNIAHNTIYFCDRQFSWTVGYPRTYVATGCTRVFIDTRMSLSGNYVSQLCNIIETENVDVVYMPGYLVKDVLSHPEYTIKFKKVNVIFVSGERFPISALPLKGQFCKKLVSWYGSTESGTNAAFQSDLSQDYEDGIIGSPLPGGEIKIVDDHDNVVPLGVSGQLCLRSPWRFNGYYGMPELFEKALDSHGWFRPADVARMRKDGQIIIEGRSRELISMQTFKYFPWEIEKTLRKCPGVKFAIAVGVPDPRFNQVVCACVIPESDVSCTEENLKMFCDNTFLEDSTSAGLSLKPKYYLVLSELPLTSSGKIDRRRIGIFAKQNLGL